MPKINTAGSGHVAPPPNSGIEWQQVTDARELKVLQDAIFIIDNRIKGYQPCNKAFKALPGGRTFDELWADPDVWISRDSSNDGTLWGATNRVGGKDITVTRYSLRMGRWTVAATLVHELAHTDGATTADSKAEDTLISCLLSGLHDPTVIGMNDPMSQSRMA